MKRKIIQIVFEPYDSSHTDQLSLVSRAWALCDDGTVWRQYFDKEKDTHRWIMDMSYEELNQRAWEDKAG